MVAPPRPRIGMEVLLQAFDHDFAAIVDRIDHQPDMAGALAFDDDDQRIFRTCIRSCHAPKPNVSVRRLDGQVIAAQFDHLCRSVVVGLTWPGLRAGPSRPRWRAAARSAGRTRRTIMPSKMASVSGRTIVKVVPLSGGRSDFHPAAEVLRRWSGPRPCRRRDRKCSRWSPPSRNPGAQISWSISSLVRTASGSDDALLDRPWPRTRACDRCRLPSSDLRARRCARRFCSADRLDQCLRRACPRR